jgi:four helix bundle protein
MRHGVWPNGRVGDYRKLDVWRVAHEMTLAVYRVSSRFPTAERFSLTSQIRRSAASVAANLAEGSGRDSDRDFARFVAIAASSASETEYHVILAHDLGYIDATTSEELGTLISRTRSMLTKLHRVLTTSRHRAAGDG